MNDPDTGQADVHNRRGGKIGRNAAVNVAFAENFFDYLQLSGAMLG